MQNEKMIVCRCEEVTYKELMETKKTYNCSARELKLRTRAGMGYCGGRTCRGMIDKIAMFQDSPKNNKEVSLKYQPPIRPVSFTDLGGVKQ
ncbi:MULTISPECIES: (2Fe-2S)-binding protein [Oceanobacillus]|uniref:Pyridine nucleotide-disulfide oxidoreductase n=1 Tax=Oceanobacillus indicireducens TaxID=1004261 RepID=A0A917Y3Z8_9BACI|nr:MULTISPECIES: (2Fe-2S)-binding protein [Oceanobacillus]GGN64139.1 pyridine nucleotide-disulfide oxidoreductase [Oceanobacillus indicireducens]